MMDKDIHILRSDYFERLEQAAKEVAKDPLGPTKSGMTFERFQILLDHGMIPTIENWERLQAQTEETED